MTKALQIAAALTIAASASAADFDRVFADSTLRVDYTLAGNATESHVFLNRQHKSAGWYGRRHNLASLPYEGNGIITVTDSLSGDTIFRTSFSTLFKEWQETDEACKTSRSFENSFLIPLPRKAAKITISLLGNRHEVTATNSHIYSPADILVSELMPAYPSAYSYIHKGGDPRNAIDVAILAEGYTEAERDSFIVDVRFASRRFQLRRRLDTIGQSGHECAARRQLEGNRIRIALRHFLFRQISDNTQCMHNPR